MSDAGVLLGIDTCGPLGTVALARIEKDEAIVLTQTVLAGKTYSAELIPAIRGLLAAQNIAFHHLVTIVVTKGPGGFTGIRIGLSTAKGLAEAKAVPIIAVSRLAVLACKAQTSAAALDASRGEFYFGSFSGRSISAIRSEQLLSRDLFLARAADLGPQLAVCEESLRIAPSATLVDPPTAADALHLAFPRLRAQDYDDPVLLDGDYLRRSDAEIFSKPKIAPAL
ncbi:MAG TPA: tRNA (adenosine(37)-N6)-threonylcarbamoyltransferase complex dimerization subunit type 1 TsaB [Acidobacteriaceae bacterium]|jgi:tRNA threonylcarbamoyladenosine biosynthesis protein TsaB|nr:tRNA (adenosine(37)-N6)-threonylcarbamoyltransferase complex dimerization subunit type 1 TsaB [Acidobacteriaceae bacterium]